VILEEGEVFEGMHEKKMILLFWYFPDAELHLY
jgi:hypothetical protein